ncbi:hypothetical protein DTO013E5_6527 [Penicillium roqueforti]|nr:uncharacterized protein LCP9604111_4039 [Penicillium roqueforti]KAF9249939.1 hypothetical protein LCP9604111_4039 [Penicillium roqueforti]KAI1837204.1 hypothetical protein CBS147337_2456 [Penicillium roqueforti]KAI2673778.1 hypothetical protein CBS147355_7537 [Penicillium roqueforti]KAI2684839.1 hypothetical protein LCP963914a_4931 [Penicillium roqueforti]KAI2704622.1 hypothetical protein CBS147372_3091 [Penicillium roqueforti]
MSTVAIMPPSRISTPPSVAVSPVKSPTKTSALPPFTDPPGWTSNPSNPLYQEEWIGADSEGQVIARDYGLQPGQPVMEDDYGWHTIFLSGNKFYLWGRLNDEVEEFVSQDIREITSSMSQSGLKGLARKPLP